MHTTYITNINRNGITIKLRKITVDKAKVEVHGYKGAIEEERWIKVIIEG